MLYVYLLLGRFSHHVMASFDKLSSYLQYIPGYFRDGTAGTYAPISCVLVPGVSPSTVPLASIADISALRVSFEQLKQKII